MKGILSTNKNDVKIGKILNFRLLCWFFFCEQRIIPISFQLQHFDLRLLHCQISSLIVYFPCQFLQLNKIYFSIDPCFANFLKAFAIIMSSWFIPSSYSFMSQIGQFLILRALPLILIAISNHRVETPALIIAHTQCVISLSSYICI